MKTLVVAGIIIWMLIMIPISKIVYKKYMNPCNLMNVIWSICCGISAVGLYDFYVPTIKTYGYILCMLFWFSTICCLVTFITFSKSNIQDNVQPQKIININCKFLLILLVVFDLILIPVFFKNLQYLSRGNFHLAHAMALKGGNGTTFSKMQEILYQFIIQPYYVALYIIAAYASATKSNKSRKIISLGILAVLSETLATVGRHGILIFGIFFIVAYSINLGFIPKGNIIKIHREDFIKVKKMAFVVLIVLGTITLVTIGRMIDGMSVGSTFVQYIGGNIIYLDLIINNMEIFGISRGKYLFGMGTFGFLSIPISVISTLFLGDYKGVTNLNGAYVGKFFYISPTVKYNSGCTIIYTFLRDYGPLGIVIGSIFFAVIVSAVYTRWLKSSCNSLWSCIWIFITYLVVYSFWRYEAAQSIVLCIYWIVFILSNWKVTFKKSKYI